jgi:hypothetical protein
MTPRAEFAGAADVLGFAGVRDRTWLMLLMRIGAYLSITSPIVKYYLDHT